MAAGDRVVAINQYEFNDFLFGAGTLFHPGDIDGLLGAPPVRSNDPDRQGGWGNFPGKDAYFPRTISFDLNVDGDRHTAFQLMREAQRAFILLDYPIPFVFQLDDGRGKVICYMRPRRNDWKMTYDVHAGWSVGSVMLMGHDPCYYSFDEVTLGDIVIGSTTKTIEVTNFGEVASSPVIEINGPITNPSIANAADGGREIRLTIVVAGGHLLTVDLKRRIVLLDGAPAPLGTIADDNQWWRMVPGVNELTFTRTNNTAISHITIRYQDAWIT